MSDIDQDEKDLVEDIVEEYERMRAGHVVDEARVTLFQGEMTAIVNSTEGPDSVAHELLRQHSGCSIAAVWHQLGNGEIRFYIQARDREAIDVEKIAAQFDGKIFLEGAAFHVPVIPFWIERAFEPVNIEKVKDAVKKPQ